MRDGVADASSKAYEQASDFAAARADCGSRRGTTAFSRPEVRSADWIASDKPRTLTNCSC
jgi:hypothetical protein